MNNIKKYISSSLKFKILSVSALFLSGMLASILVGGHFLVQQNRVIQQAVFDAGDRAKKATNARFSLIRIDNSIQKLIAADEPADIRKATIALIQGGALLKENLIALKNVMPESQNVIEMISLINILRPAQFEVISLAKKNLDTEAIYKAKNIVSSINKIDELNNIILDEAQSAAKAIVESSASEADQILNMIALFGAIGVLLGAIIAMLAARTISTPLVKLERVMEKMANGDLTSEIDFALASKDELGRILRAISVTIDKQRDLVTDISSATKQVSIESSNILFNAQDIGKANQKLNRGVRTINENTRRLHHATNVATQKLEDAATKTLLVAENAEHNSQKTLGVAVNFIDFQSKIQLASHNSQELSITANEIQAITKTINSISKKINLLAINAAIEAAHAGEHGLGFSVVAEEVRTLASHTSKASENISNLIDLVSDRVQSTVKSIEETVVDAETNISELQLLAQASHNNSSEVTKISESMVDLVGLMAEQEDANKQISETVDQLGSLATHSTGQTSSLNKLSSNLDDAAKGLFKVVTQFKILA